MGRHRRSKATAGTPRGSRAPGRLGRPGRSGGPGRSTLPTARLLVLAASLLLVLSLAAPLVPAQDPSDPTAALRPQPPQNVTAQAGPGPGNVSIDWAAPDGTEGAVVTEYRVYRANGTVSDPNATTMTRIATVPATQTSYQDQDLPNGATFTYTVRAHWAATSPDPGVGTGDVGMSRHSAPDTATTFDVPSRPLDLAAKAGPNPGEISLSWSQPSDDGGLNVTAYRVLRDHGEDNTTQVASLSPSNTTYVATGIPDGTTAAYRVAAVNAAGVGPTAGPVDATTFATATPVRNLTASPGPEPDSVTLVWIAPADNGGARITSYVLSAGPSADALDPLAEIPSEDASSFVYRDTNLSAGQPRSYAVAAVNIVGTGPAAHAATTTYDVPGAVPMLTAEPGPDPGQVTLSWTAPPTPDGDFLPVTGYRILRGSSADTLQPAGATDAGTLNHTDADLPEGTTWTYAVQALNPVGAGPVGPTVTAEPLAPPPEPEAPGAVQDLTASAGPGDDAVTLTWSPPADDGGANLTGYRVYRALVDPTVNASATDATDTTDTTDTTDATDAVDPGELVVTLDANATEHVDAGLTPGATYVYRVVAVNAAGEGPLGTAAEVSLPGADTGGTVGTGPTGPGGGTGPGPSGPGGSGPTPGADTQGAPIALVAGGVGLIIGVVLLVLAVAATRHDDVRPWARRRIDRLRAVPGVGALLGHLPGPGAMDPGHAGHDGQADAVPEAEVVLVDAQGRTTMLTVGGAPDPTPAIHGPTTRPTVQTHIPDHGEDQPSGQTEAAKADAETPSEDEPAPSAGTVVTAEPAVATAAATGASATDAPAAEGPDRPTAPAPASHPDPHEDAETMTDADPATPIAAFAAHDDGPDPDVFRQMGAVPFELDPYDPRRAAGTHRASARSDVEAAAERAEAANEAFAKAAGQALRRAALPSDRTDGRAGPDGPDDGPHADAAAADPWTALETAKDAAHRARAHRARADLLAEWSADAARLAEETGVDDETRQAMADRWGDLLARRLARGPLDEDDGAWLLMRLEASMATRAALERARDALVHLTSSGGLDPTEETVEALDDVLCAWARDVTGHARSARSRAVEPRTLAKLRARAHAAHGINGTGVDTGTGAAGGDGPLAMATPAGDADRDADRGTAPDGHGPGQGWSGGYADPADGPAHALADLLVTLTDLADGASGPRRQAARAVLDAAGRLRHPGLMAPRMADLARQVRDADAFDAADLERLQGTLDALRSRERLVLDVELPRRMGLALGPAAGEFMLDTAAAVARRHPRRAPAEALSSYLDGKADAAPDGTHPTAGTSGPQQTSDAGSDGALLRSAARALTAALPQGHGPGGLDSVLARAVARELTRRRVASLDALAMDLLGGDPSGRDRVQAVASEMAVRGQLVYDAKTDLLARPFTSPPSPEDLHRLRRRLHRLTGGTGDASARILDRLLEAPASPASPDPPASPESPDGSDPASDPASASDSPSGTGSATAPTDADPDADHVGDNADDDADVDADVDDSADPDPHPDPDPSDDRGDAP